MSKSNSTHFERSPCSESLARLGTPRPSIGSSHKIPSLRLAIKPMSQPFSAEDLGADFWNFDGVSDVSEDRSPSPTRRQRRGKEQSEFTSPVHALATDMTACPHHTSSPPTSQTNYTITTPNVVGGSNLAAVRGSSPDWDMFGDGAEFEAIYDAEPISAQGQSFKTGSRAGIDGLFDDDVGDDLGSESRSTSARFHFNTADCDPTSASDRSAACSSRLQPIGNVVQPITEPIKLISDLPPEVQEFYLNHWRRGAEKFAAGEGEKRKDVRKGAGGALAIESESDEDQPAPKKVRAPPKRGSWRGRWLNGRGRGKAASTRGKRG